jgi:hypothetical protein
MQILLLALAADRHEGPVLGEADTACGVLAEALTQRLVKRTDTCNTEERFLCQLAYSVSSDGGWARNISRMKALRQQNVDLREMRESDIANARAHCRFRLDDFPLVR